MVVKRPQLDSTDTPINRAIAIGINAPNPHNTQAWKFTTFSDLNTLLYADERRLLPATDPVSRQIHIGCGCFLETLAIGATGFGYETTVDLFPEGPYRKEEIGKKPVARISLSKSSLIGRDDLYEYISNRQTNRKNYDGPAKMVSDAEFDSLKESFAKGSVETICINDQEGMRPFLDIFYKAMEVECLSHDRYEESRLWFRFNERQRAEKRDGLSVAQMGVDGLRRRFLEWYLRNGNPSRWHSKTSIDRYLQAVKKGIDSSQGLLLLKTRTNNQMDWIKTGQSYSRAGLAAAKLGLHFHPYSQVLQEYSEMRELQSEFNRLAGIKGEEKIQMAVRVGRADPAYYPYRRTLKSFLH